MKALFGVQLPELPCTRDAPISEFEQLLITRIRMKRHFDLFLLGAIYNQPSELIGKIVNMRAQDWGELGMDLSILDIDTEYLRQELPTEYVTCGMTNICALVDEKEANMSNIRTISYQTPMGLSFENIGAYWAHGAANGLIKMWGTPRGLKTPEVEFIAGSDTETVAPLPLCPSRALERSESGPFSTLNDGKKSADNEDGVELDIEEDLEDLIASLRLREVDDEDDEEEQAAAADTRPSQNHLDLCTWGQQFLARQKANGADNAAIRNRNQLRRAANQQEHTVHAPDIEKCNEYLLTGEGPNKSAAAKKRQLLRLQRLDLLYRTGRLTKCTLSYYLSHTRGRRNSLWLYLNGMGPEVRLPTRLEKMPLHYAIVGDQGFAKDSIYYPNVNAVITPDLPLGVPQRFVDTVMLDFDLSRKRYKNGIGVVPFVQDELESDEMRHQLARILHHVVHSEYANINLHQPLRSPPDWDSYLSDEDAIPADDSQYQAHIDLL
mmetsp:Transcript_2942/g.5000  ORF Transcript_2942/g.5000 Transcript_2942/m.5000 type:complete len:493 (+) Transcript_2942:257-1735(+)